MEGERGKKKRERDRGEKRNVLRRKKESREDGNLFVETRRDDTSGIYSR